MEASEYDFRTLNDAGHQLTVQPNHPWIRADV
jgi:hypothetical protein